MTPVERVAWAIHKVSSVGYTWEEESDSIRSLCLDEARAAIEAFEPSEGMLNAVWDTIAPYDRSGLLAEAIFNAMRRAALEET